MSNTTEDIIDTEPDAPAQEQQAFSAHQRTWQGIPLAPFAVDREAEWMLHRQQVGAPPLPEIIQDVGAMALDAMRVLWFCAHDPKEWIEAPDGEQVKDELIGFRWRRFTPKERAAKLEARIREWAKDTITGATIPDAVSLFYEIFSSAHSTRAIIASDGKARGMGN